MQAGGHKAIVHFSSDPESELTDIRYPRSIALVRERAFVPKQ